MTKEITKAYILQEMQDKFALREFEASNFLFAETVVPVYNIEQHVQHQVADYKSVNVTSAPTALLFYTVPMNEKWTLTRYNVVFMGAGAYTVTGVTIRRKKELNASYIYLDMELGRTVSYAIDLPKAIVLEPGDTIYVYIDSFTSQQHLRLYIDYTLEEIR